MSYENQEHISGWKWEGKGAERLETRVPKQECKEAWREEDHLTETDEGINI